MFDQLQSSIPKCFQFLLFLSGRKTHADNASVCSNKHLWAGAGAGAGSLSRLVACSESWREKERQLRDRVKRVLPVDVHQPQPLGAASLAPLPADALLSAFCLEAVSPDLASFRRALGHITTLLRPGGHLLLIGALEESWYQAGGVRLGVVPVSAGAVREALVRGGYEVRDLRTFAMPAPLQTGVDDAKGVFFAWAQKRAGV